MVNIGIIGCGYWGANFVRIAKESFSAELVHCSDLSEKNLEIASHNLEGVIKTTTEFNDVLQNPKVDAVIIATPTVTHFEIAKKALEAGKHVLVEKPMTENSEQAKKLIEISKEQKKVLMVGHVFKFNPGIQKLKEYIDSGEIGSVLYTHSSRTGLGPVRKDVNVLWDLAPHDVSILLHLLKEKPLSVSATGASYIQKGIEDVVFLTIKFGEGIISNLHLSWLDPYKIRKTTVIGDKKMAVFDDVGNETVKLLDKGVSYLRRGASFGEFRGLLVDGDIIIPKIEVKEPLKEEFNHFVECVKENREPMCSGEDGYRVVKVLESAQKSLKENGNEIKIEF